MLSIVKNPSSLEPTFGNYTINTSSMTTALVISLCDIEVLDSHSKGRDCSVIQPSGTSRAFVLPAPIPNLSYAFGLLRDLPNIRKISYAADLPVIVNKPISFTEP